MIKEALAQKSDDEIQLIFEQELNEILGALAKGAGKFFGKKAAQTAGKEALIGAEKAAAKKAAGASLKDKALDYGAGALNFMSGGEDEEDDGSWSSKLANWGGMAGNIAGDIAGGIAGGGVASIPAAIAGGAAGGFLGRKIGKTLGGLIDTFTSGNRTSAIKSLAKMIITGAIPAAGLAMAAKSYFNTDEDSDPEALSGMLDSVKKYVPQQYHDEIDDSIDLADQEAESDIEDNA